MRNEYYESDLRSVKELLEKGYAYVKINPFFLEYAKSIVSVFRTFTQLPIEKRKVWTFDVGTTNKPDVGYIRRDDDELKHFMHHFYFLPDLLANRNVIYPEFKKFLKDMDMLHKYGEQRVKMFAEAFDDVYPGYFIASRLDSIEASMQSVMRSLQYDHCRVELEETAGAHEDQSLLTLQMFETHKGLYINSTHNLYEVKPGCALIFPGKKMQLVTGGKETFFEKKGFRYPKIVGGKIKALTHGVVSLPEEFGDDYERQSIVLFTHDPSTVLTPKMPIQAV